VNTIKPNCVKKCKIAQTLFTLASCLLPCHNVSKETQAPELVKNLMARTKTEIDNNREKQGIIAEVLNVRKRLKKSTII
jgi:hypothetical protein